MTNTTVPSTNEDESTDHPENQSLLLTDKAVTNIFSSKSKSLNYSTHDEDPPVLQVQSDDTGSTERISCRSVLWYLAFVGFAINYMIRINMNIAIVDMILPKKLNIGEKQIVISECVVPIDQFNGDMDVINSSNIFNQNTTVTTTDDLHREGKFSFERALLRMLNVNYDEYGFDWDEHQQGLLLGSFYWLHWVTQVPGGILARKYGTKRVFGLANFIGCLLCSLVPILSFVDLKLVLILRTFQGFILGCAWPSMHHMTAQWIPPNERSNFVTAYLGSSIGIAVFFPIFGFIIGWSSWEWVFHLCAVIGLLWFLAWQYFVYDSPSEHPRIDPKERAYIEKSLGGSFQHKDKIQIPWKHILTSRPVWTNIISQFGGIWALFTLMTQAPTYFKTILGWGVKSAGLLSGFPHLARMIFAYYFSMFGDWLLKTNKLSRTNVRKLAGTVCNIVNGCFLICLAFSGCNSLAAVIFLTMATSLHGAVSTGPLASVVDISPNFSGIVLGMNGMIGVLPGFISPIVVGYLTLGNQTVQQWQYVFLIAAGLAILTGLQYVVFSSSELQSWNDLNKSKAENDLIDQKSELCNINKFKIESDRDTSDKR